MDRPRTITVDQFDVNNTMGLSLGSSLAAMKNLHHPGKDTISLFGILYALSEPVRFSIVDQLAEGSELTCGAFKLPASKGKSTMTHHFKVLRDSGLIHTRVEGREHFTSLRKDDINERFPFLLDNLLKSYRSWIKTAPSLTVSR
jgi:DNA-binding transcriptional ArsR family regulator